MVKELVGNCDAKISVIVPVYNTESSLLKKSVSSLQAQTIKVEIIIVDDGSVSDDTLYALQQIEEQGIRVLHVENKGQGSARNIAFEHAHGEFIGYLDSDDWLDENFYEELYSLCIKDSSDIACGSIVLESPEGQRYWDKQKDGMEDTLEGKFSRVNNGSCCNKIFRRTLVAQAKFPEEYYFEDNAMLAEMLILSGKVSYTNKVKYHYFQHQASTVHNAKKEHKRESDSIVILSYIKGVTQSLPVSYQEVVIGKFYNILLDKTKYATNPFYHKAIDALFYGRCVTETKLSFIETLFSVTTCSDKRYKRLTILGLSIKFKNKKYFKSDEYNIVNHE